MRTGIAVTGLALLALAGPAASAAVDPALSPRSVHTADLRKNKVYVDDGIVVGGDRNVNDVVILGLRHATQAGFERFVLDLEGNGEGDSVAIERAPFYQVSVAPDTRQVVFTVWGNPKIGFDPSKAVAKLKNSSVVKNVELLPVLEKDRWSFVVHLREPRAVEVFELSRPVRVILDIRTASR
ncbi:MAG: hypothetical protein IT285_12055 [Bdellovibrionales bacterium]|nr:hypothetical protein [Bdellovibrionales bacterium]